MKKLLLSAAAMLAVWSSTQAAVIFVDVDASGTNTGDSWTNAYNDVQDAITNSSANDEIWVAEGTYYPDASDQSIYYELKADVSLYGGFAGTESTRSEREWWNHETILSGDIDQDGTWANNSYCIFSNLTSSGYNILDHDVVIDGFSVTEARSVTGEKSVIQIVESGPVFRNCKIYNNKSEHYIVLVSDNGTSDQTTELIFDNCLFYRNKEHNGGNLVVYYDIRISSSNISEIKNCTFSGNQDDGIVGYNLKVYNTIIWDQVGTEITASSGGSMTVEYCDIQGGYTGTGNINSDPKYVDETNDNYRLLCTSPCLDAGDDTHASSEDLDGNDRTFGTVDMGCYEKQFGNDWTEVVEIQASDRQAGDKYGQSVDISGTYAVVGARWADVSGKSNAGAAYVFEFVNGEWQQVQIITAPSTPSGEINALDNFGISVAIDGDKLVVGENGDDGAANGAGAVHVYERNSSTGIWEHDRKITADDDISDAKVDAQFGYSVDISGDLVIVGAYRYDDGANQQGKAYIYDISTSTSDNVAELVSGFPDLDDKFGSSVAIDGDYAIVGVPYDDDEGMDAGAVYIYEYNSGTSSWDQKNKHAPSALAGGEWFGVAVDVDAGTALVGASKIDGSKGAGYIIDVTAGTISSAKLQPTTGEGLSASSFMGTSVAIDGDYLIMGATGGAGSAYIYNYTTSWSFDEKITASNGDSGDKFGKSVGLSGANIVVGADEDNIDGSNTNAGTAYIFQTCDDAPSTQIEAIDNGITYQNESLDANTTGSGATQTNEDDEASPNNSVEDKMDQDIALNIYPNPSNGFFTIESSFIIRQIVVFNSLGSLVQSESCSVNNKSLNLNNLPKGLYTLKIQTADQALIRRIIIK